MKEKFIKLKGYNLHIHVRNILNDYKKDIDDKDVSSYIRYDKSLRDRLFVYLSTLEEHLRAYLNNNYKLVANNEIFHKYRLKRKSDEIVCKKEDFSSKSEAELEAKKYNDLYYKNNLMFSELVKLYEIIEVNYSNFDDRVFIKHLNNINALRNNVMHHELLVLGKEKRYCDVLIRKDELKKQIISLVHLLPLDYRANFLDDLYKMKINNKITGFKIDFTMEVILYKCLYNAKHISVGTKFKVRDLYDILKWLQVDSEVRRYIGIKFYKEVMSNKDIYKVKYLDEQKTDKCQQIYEKVK